MPSDEDFDDIFNDFDFFNSRFIKKLQNGMDELFKEIKNGKLEGTWETREITEPSVKGHIFQGRFGTHEAPEPLDPLKPLKRRPAPEKPFELLKKAQDETREPLTDIFEEENATKIYVELPGEEKENIHLKVTNEGIEVKAKNFYKMIELPNKLVEQKPLPLEYKNGVLEITVPKKIRLRREDAEKQKQA